MGSGPNRNQMQPNVRDVEACPASLRPMCTMPTFQSFRIEGRVTTSCLWHACRAVTIGTILIGTGITMAILGNSSSNEIHERKIFSIFLCCNGNHEWDCLFFNDLWLQFFSNKR